MAVISTKKHSEVVTRSIHLEGTKPIMFDRYAGDNKTQLEPHQKMYFLPGDSRIIGLPAANIMSFFSAHNTNSAPKRLRDARQFKKICNACLSFMAIEEDFIQFSRDGEPIRFDRFNSDDVDPVSGVYVHRSVARLEKGIPNPKVRPVLPLPWSLKFHMVLHPNREIDEQEIRNLLDEGGRAIGLGTFRGMFGKFKVVKFE